MSTLVDLLLTVLWVVGLGAIIARARRPRPRHVWGELASADVMAAHRRGRR